MPSPRTLKLLLATAALGLAVAAPASADSVAYLKNGDVWLASTDGAREFQVTGGGGYTSVAQADDGTIAAVNAARHIVRMDRLGTVLSDIDTPVSSSLPGSYMTFQGPWDIDVSPNGQTIAYGFHQEGFQQSPSGDISASTTNGVGLTRATQLTGFTEPGYKYATDWDAPEFADDQHLLVSNGPGWPSDPIATEVVGSGDPRSWFHDGDIQHPMDATISRDKKTLAFVVGPDRKALRLYRNPTGELGANPATMQFCGELGDQGDGFKYNSPTLNADGTRLVWGTGPGMDVLDIPADCTQLTGGRPVTPGGSNPDWGPADVPASRPAPPKPTPGPAPVPPAGKPAIAVKAGKAKLAKVLKHGVTLKLAVPAAGKVTGKAKLGRRRVAGGAATARAAGAVTLRLKPTKAGKAALRKAHGGTLRVTLRQGAVTQTAKVEVGR